MRITIEIREQLMEGEAGATIEFDFLHPGLDGCGKGHLFVVNVPDVLNWVYSYFYFLY